MSFLRPSFSLTPSWRGNGTSYHFSLKSDVLPGIYLLQVKTKARCGFSVWVQLAFVSLKLSSKEGGQVICEKATGVLLGSTLSTVHVKHRAEKTISRIFHAFKIQYCTRPTWSHLNQRLTSIYTGGKKTEPSHYLAQTSWQSWIN